MPKAQPLTLPVLNATQVDEALARLRTLQVDSCDIDHLKECLAPLFTGLAVRVYRYNAGAEVFRGRILASRPTNLKEIREPAPEHIVLPGRCNRAGVPIFYSSSDRNAVFYELDVHSGDRVAIVRWRTEAEVILNNVGFDRAAFNTLGANRVAQDMEVEGGSVINTRVREYLAAVFTTPVPPGSEEHYRPLDRNCGALLVGIPVWGPSVSLGANVWQRG